MRSWTSTACARSISRSWDGRDGNGLLAAPGRYAVHLRAYGGRGQSRHADGVGWVTVAGSALAGKAEPSGRDRYRLTADPMAPPPAASEPFDFAGPW